MADDGLMLNFELPTSAFSLPKTTFKGGSWKDRLTARKSAEYGRKKAAERAGNSDLATSSQELETLDHDARPRKKPRTASSGGVPPKAIKGDFVSSLFTYNPISTVAKEASPTLDIGPVEPSNAPLNDEFSRFTSLGLSANIAGHLLKRLNITAPTAIQRKAVKQLCEADTDAFIQAQTGSGKTLAYLLPVVERISAISREMKGTGEEFSRDSGLFAIVLAPTRELSKQISTVLEDLLSCCHWIVSGTVIGGEKKKSEKARLRKGLNILIATPGRLADHLNHTEVLDVSKVRWLVLDEGDRLMELGFEQDIQRIISVLNLRSKKTQEKQIPGLPERRTTVLCSATIKADVEQLGSISLKNPVAISVDSAEAGEDAATAEIQAFSAPTQLKQSYAVVPAKQRLVTLTSVLKQTFRRKGSVMKCIVFISCADSVDFHFEILTHDRKRGDAEKAADQAKEDLNPAVGQKLQYKIHQGNTISESITQGLGTAFSNQSNPVQVFRLHGSLQQATRTSTLKSFRELAEPAVLICTDVASRGLDLPNIDLVIEYDPPFSKDDHLHRIGRTARAGRDGRAMIFLQPGCEEGYVEILKEGKPRHLTRHDAQELLKKGFGRSSEEDGSTMWEVRATDWQLDMERFVLENPKQLERARRAYQSHIRAYTTHVAAERGVFNMQELHLGHLAKAFALRDKPGSIRVPGLRPGADSGKKGRGSRDQQGIGKAAAGNKRRSDQELDDDTQTVDAQEARKKMFAKMKSIGGASEFNLG